MQDNLAAFERRLLADCVDLQPIEHPWLSDKNVTTSVARFDAYDSALSGNKAFKLLPHLIKADELGIKTLISFGGWHSNHLHALANAGNRFGFKTIGMVRGYSDQPLSETLLDAKALGMELRFMSRAEYALRYDADYRQELANSISCSMVIEEGGAGGEGVLGGRLMANMLMRSLPKAPDYIVMPLGTATTFSGFLTADEFYQTEFIGIAALKDAENMRATVLEAQSGKVRSGWHVDDRFTFGGFAKLDAELARFIADIESTCGVPLDPVYNAKAFYAAMQMVKQGRIKPGSNLVLVHTGGLQGKRGMQQRIERLLSV